MYKQFYKGMEFTDLPLFAMVFFMTVFAVVVVRMMLVKRKADFAAVEQLPLQDDAVSTRTNTREASS